MKAVVVIPIYKDFERTSVEEIESLKQNIKVFKTHDIIFVAPKSFDCLNFSKSNIEFLSCRWELFDNYSFSSIRGYNELLLSWKFYDRFSQYDFILISQPDAWVFKDELDFWCSKGFDYIGAPWFEGMDKPSKNNKIIGVGNGGFSLRKIDKAKSVIHKLELIKKFRIFWFRSRFQSLIDFTKFLNIIKRITSLEHLEKIQELIFYNGMNEDFFWTQIIGKSFKNYNVAPIKDAIKFSFEVNPSILFTMNNETLPFGCHAWGKYEPDFWKKYIVS